MDLFTLILLIYLSYRNALKAKTKGLNAVLWGFITFTAVFIAEMIGAFIVVFYFLRNVINIDKLATDPSYKDVAMEQLKSAFISNPLHPTTIIVMGFGGYLLVRYILDKKPSQNNNRE